MGGVALDMPVELYPVDIVAVRHEYFTERRAGKRFDDFLNERMNGRTSINVRLDEKGQSSVCSQSRQLVGPCGAVWRRRSRMAASHQMCPEQTNHRIGSSKRIHAHKEFLKLSVVRGQLSVVSSFLTTTTNHGPGLLTTNQGLLTTEYGPRTTDKPHESAASPERQSRRSKDVDVPEPAGEALVRVLLSGICNTDIEIARGYAGFKGTIGHEFVGIVEDSPNGEMVGERVVGEINAGCGECSSCLANDPRHCATRTVLGIVGRDGAHAEFFRLPLSNLLRVPEKIADEHAVFAEPLGAACGIMERASITSDTKVAVIGDGKLGLLCAQAIALTGAPVLVIGKHSGKLRIAERRGIETANSQAGSKKEAGV